jgi:hypothetical protein
VPLLCRSPDAPPSPRYRRRPTAAASCRGPGVPVPRARHGHAAALGCQAPRACVRTRAVLPPFCLALAVPWSSLVVHAHPATRPRRRVRVAAMSLGHSPEHPPGARTARALGRHTHAHTHLHRCTRSGPPHRIPRTLTPGPVLSEKRRERRRQPARRRRRRASPARGEGEGERRPSPRRKGSRPAEGSEPSQPHAQSAHLPSRPAEPQAELPPRA